MDQEIITRIKKKKKTHPSFYSLALWCVVSNCGRTLAGSASSSGPGIFPSLVWRRKTPMAGPSYGWMTKTTAGLLMPPIPLQLARLQMEFI